MGRRGVTPDWVAPVADYLIDTLPTEDGDIDDMAMTPWQFGCMGLDEMGYAEGHDWGARLLPRPIPVNRWPLIQDMATIVLTVSHQVKEFEVPGHDRPTPPIFEGPIGTNDTRTKPAKVSPFRVVPIAKAGAEISPSSRNLRPMKISGVKGLPDATASRGCCRALMALGLVDQGKWTAAAWIPLARRGLGGLTVTGASFPGFQAALARCLATMPAAVRQSIESIRMGPPNDELASNVNELVRQRDPVAREIMAYEGRRRAAMHLGKPIDPEPDVSKEPLTESLRRTRKASTTKEWQDRAHRIWRKREIDKLDNAFFLRWRFDLGWDPDAPIIPLFRDSLAQAMRDAVLEVA